MSTRTINIKTFAITLCLLIFIFGMQTIHANQSVNNFEHCFESAMVGKAGNIAEREAQATCRKQFPKIIQGEPLPQAAIDQLKIDAGFGWGIFNGTIYNGNREYIITQLTLSMTPIHDDHHMEMHAHMSHETKQHQIDLNLAPLTKGALSMALTGDDIHVHDFEWKVIEVIGYKAN